ncbi:MAG: TatD family deoxyribonuclease [Gammaproteobacteria bacterium]|nr:MAG: TatD family deoxyribonuclease [Gammaproteobacteria bacterium]
MLVDSHCHIDTMGDKTLKSAAEYIKNAQAAGVGYLQCVSINIKDFPNVLKVAQEFENVYASVGVHPNCRAELDAGADELIRLAQDKEIISIGETGLDYYRSSGDLDWQRDRFRKHITVAREVKKPLVIHIRDAFDDAYEIMCDDGVADIGGVIHCFTGTLEQAKKVIDLGFHIGISGIVTYKKAEEIHEVATNIPLEKLLVETDSPYLAPVPYRGKKNQPAYVTYVAERIARLRGIDKIEVAKATTENFFKCFNLEKP